METVTTLKLPAQGSYEEAITEELRSFYSNLLITDIDRESVIRQHSYLLEKCKLHSEKMTEIARLMLTGLAIKAMGKLFTYAQATLLLDDRADEKLDATYLHIQKNLQSFRLDELFPILEYIKAIEKKYYIAS